MNARPGGVDIQDPARGFLAVQFRDGAIAVGLDPHFHESEAFQLPAFAISDETDAFDRPVWLEQESKRGFRGVRLEISDEDILHLASSGQLRIGAGSDERGRPLMR
ncbi:MAG TPA: hypothetical protein VKX39_00970 [Bryobacteraceae bacterium]|jgi:hypothetical protein|nr:hypothetical protein [Bryobacteraceae bacterium]